MDVEMLEARARFYHLLSRVFTEEPSLSLVDGLAEASTPRGAGPDSEASPLVQGFRVLGGIDACGDPAPLLEALRWDYTRLFVGPRRLPAPPYESVYTSPERLVMQAATLRVREKYARMGLQIRAKGRPDDHVGVELGFMDMLCRETAGALRSGDAAHAGRLMDMQTSFFREHLSRWVPRFCDDVIRNAETCWFRGAALVCKGFMELEEELLAPAAEVAAG